MCKFEQRLNQMAIAAQKHPPDSLERRKAVDRFFRLLQQSGKLSRPSVPPTLQGSYEEIYAIATQQLFGYIYRKLDNYDPQRGGVLTWVNFLLHKRFPLAIREISGKNWRKTTSLPTLSDLENSGFLKSQDFVSSDPDTVEAQDIVACLEEDPEGLFENTYTCKRPDANFRFIALKIVAGYTWQDISDELDLKIPTLSAFYQRKLTYFTPKIQEYLS